MKFRMMTRNVGVALAFILIVAAGVVFLPHQTTPASAATNRILPSFNESVDGHTYTWKEVTPWYATTSTRRVDTGKWVVKEGRYSLGTIEVGVNEFTSSTNHPGWAVDTTTSIRGIYIPHEISEPSYPNEGRVQHESPWGFADSFYGPNSPVSYIDSPSKGPFPSQQDIATGSQALPMFNNMQHQIAIQRDAYYKMENVYKAGARADIMGGGGRNAAGALIVAQPALVFPLSVYVLAGAGITLAFGGAIVRELCGAGHCGKHSKTWAIMGGIAVAIGTVLTVLSGYSRAGATIRAGQLAAEAFTEGTQSEAAAERMVQLGTPYASASSSFNIPGDVSAALPLVRARSL